MEERDIETAALALLEKARPHHWLVTSDAIGATALCGLPVRLQPQPFFHIASLCREDGGCLGAFDYSGLVGEAK